MKAILKRLLRGVWQTLGPVHRPILRKCDSHLRAALAPQIETSVRSVFEAVIEERLRVPFDDARTSTARTFEQIEAFREATTRAASETDLVLNSLVREIVRLQMRVEYLEQLIPIPQPEPVGALGLVDRDTPCEAMFG